MDRGIKFKEIKECISRIDRISISFEDRSYDNYFSIMDVPEGKYEEMYVYGIGMVHVEFPKDKEDESDSIAPSKCEMLTALEIYLRDRPR
ncbi:MAG: hypothetical protein K5639_06935 [Eubacterium sp.]|nr:hypothetical protein [Eubacterium sp.]